MAVMSLPPEVPREPRKWGAGRTFRTKEMWRWEFVRDGKAYVGSRVATREMADANLDAAVLAWERGGRIPAVSVRTIAGVTRGVTHGPKILAREIRIAGLEPYPEDVDRPRTRGDCRMAARPCPFASCSHHLFLDVNPETGAIKLNVPQLEVWEMAETCSLDVADRGGITLEEVGAILNLTRERIRQVEVQGLAKLAEDDGLGIPPERETYASPTPRRSGCP